VQTIAERIAHDHPFGASWWRRSIHRRRIAEFVAPGVEVHVVRL